MNNKDLVLPQKLGCDQETISNNYGRFVAEPFERGYGHTIGNSIRRILISSLEGAAISAVRIKGVSHEFAVVPGVEEDVMNIILNLKHVRFNLYSSGPELVYLNMKGRKEAKAKDIECNSNVEVLNGDLHIASLSDAANLSIEMEVNRGRGYTLEQENKRSEQPLGTINIDTLYSPVVKVHYEVENVRVGQVTDYDRLIMEIWTDGSIAPGDALAYAAKILRDSLAVFITTEEKESVSTSTEEIAEKTREEARIKDMLSQSVDIVELSVRASNCLKSAKIKTIGELVQKSDDELLNYRNFGKKSLDEIKVRLKELGLSLGSTQIK